MRLRAIACICALLSCGDHRTPCGAIMRSVRPEWVVEADEVESKTLIALARYASDERLAMPNRVCRALDGVLVDEDPLWPGVAGQAWCWTAPRRILLLSKTPTGTAFYNSAFAHEVVHIAQGCDTRREADCLPGYLPDGGTWCEQPGHEGWADDGVWTALSRVEAGVSP